MTPVAVQAERGFTLIEALVSILILTVLMLGLILSLGVTYTTNIKNAYRDQGVKIAQEILEQRASVGYPNLMVGTSTGNVTMSVGGGSVTYNTATTVTEPVANVAKLVRIKVTWDYRGKSYGYNASTVVGNR